MKNLIITVIFHMVCIVTFSIIYLSISEEFREKNNREKSLIDFISLSTTLQTGVGYTELVPLTFYSKFITALHQMIMISTHLITIYVFTL